MKDNGLVSVIMPSYNTAKYIAESIESVINQTYPYWELIIVDDCSTDDTDSVVANYLSDTRIRYLKNEKNSGAAISRNYALREAKGKWIAFLDSDDVWLPEKLEKQIAFMLEKNCSFSYTNYEEIDEASEALGIMLTGPKRITTKGMFAYCWVGCLTVMYNADAIGLVQIQDIKKNNDYAMWLQICRKADCYLLNETLGKYRKRTGSISRHGILTMVGWHYKLWRSTQEKALVTAAFWTLVNLAFGLAKKIHYKEKVESKYDTFRQNCK